MAKKGKRYAAARALVDPNARYGVEEAFALVPKLATAKFDESVDIAVRLGVNPRQADQMVRGAISLPYGTGKSVRVIVFAEGDAARAALEAGADAVGSDDLIEKVAGGWTDFDSAVSVRNLMAKVGRLGRVLGPRGLMPNPKSGTVVGPEEVAQVVREIKGGRVEFRVERHGAIVQAAIGKASMPPEQLRENAVTLIKELIRLKPASAKGTYVRGVTVSTTMGPGIRLDPNDVVRVSADVR